MALSQDDNVNEMTAQQLIEQFKMEPTVLMDSPEEEETKKEITEASIPTSNANAVQFTQRPMYSSGYNPMHERRNKAIQAIYQFLKDENLQQTLNQLQQETFRNISISFPASITPTHHINQSNHFQKRRKQFWNFIGSNGSTPSLSLCTITNKQKFRKIF